MFMSIIGNRRLPGVWITYRGEQDQNVTFGRATCGTQKQTGAPQGRRLSIVHAHESAV